MHLEDTQQTNTAREEKNICENTYNTKSIQFMGEQKKIHKKTGMCHNNNNIQINNRRMLVPCFHYVDANEFVV